MYALRERRQHVTQEDFEFAVAKVCQRWLLSDFEITDEAVVGIEAEPRRKHFCQQTFLLSILLLSIPSYVHITFRISYDNNTFINIGEFSSEGIF